MRVFLDTNILLDVLLNRPGLAAESETVILRCETLGHQMFISWHGLATAYYLLKRGRTSAETLLEIDKILGWAVVAVCGDADARKARHLAFSDFEDALQAASAESCGADCIVTRNTRDFSRSVVPVFSPTEFLNTYPAPPTE